VRPRKRCASATPLRAERAACSSINDTSFIQCAATAGGSVLFNTNDGVGTVQKLRMQRCLVQGNIDTPAALILLDMSVLIRDTVFDGNRGGVLWTQLGAATSLTTTMEDTVVRGGVLANGGFIAASVPVGTARAMR
jgi:hypothetical protein